MGGPRNVEMSDSYSVGGGRKLRSAPDLGQKEFMSEAKVGNV